MSTGQVTHGYKIVQPTNHYRVTGGIVRRDYIAVRLTDGSPRIISIREDTDR